MWVSLGASMMNSALIWPGWSRYGGERTEKFANPTPSMGWSSHIFTATRHRSTRPLPDVSNSRSRVAPEAENHTAPTANPTAMIVPTRVLCLLSSANAATAITATATRPPRDPVAKTPSATIPKATIRTRF